MRSKSATEAIEISSEEIEETSEKLGIDRKYIEDSIHRQRADKKFHNITSESENKSSKFNTVKNGILFFQNAIYSTATIPNFATVTKVESPEKQKTIKITTATEYPDLPTDELDGMFHKTFTYKLPDEYDKIQYLLDFNDVSSPSELKGKSIPIVHKNENVKTSISPIDYKIHKPKNTIWGKFCYYSMRASMRLRLFERASKCSNLPDYGKITFNKNVYIWLFILTSPIHFTAFGLINLLFIALYLLFLGWVLIRGTYSFITQEKGDRLYIKQKIEK